MMHVIAINRPDPAHLAAVIADMRRLGVPTLRAVRDETQGIILALEGSHRLAAAAALGLTPKLDILSPDTLITCAELGYDDSGWFDGEAVPLGDIRDRIADPMGTYAGCPVYDFAEGAGRGGASIAAKRMPRSRRSA